MSPSRCCTSGSTSRLYWDFRVSNRFVRPRCNVVPSAGVAELTINFQIISESDGQATKKIFLRLRGNQFFHFCDRQIAFRFELRNMTFKAVQVLIHVS